MTRIVGNVKDVGMNGVEGLLYAYSGFRPLDDGVIAPRRSYWPIKGGELPDDVNIFPGPAVLLIEAGMDARREFKVTVPDQETVTLGALVVGGFDWTEEVISIVDSYLIEMRALADQVSTDRGLSEVAREGSEQARDRAVEARNTAEQHMGHAGESAAAASDSEAAAAASEANTKTSEQSAAAHDASAGASARAASEWESRAEASASAAASSEGEARQYSEAAAESQDAAESERVTVEQIRDALQTLLDNSEAWAGFEEALSQLEPRMAAEVNKLKGDAPEAFDTLGEVATWIADHSDEAAAMLQNISERAKTTYVDEQLAGKADKGAENTAQWSQVSGTPATFPSSWPEVSGKPSVFPPSTHSHDVSTLDGWKPYSTSIDDPDTVPTRDSKGNINVPLTPTTEYSAASTGYVDSRFQVVDELPASPDPNTIYFVTE